MQHTFRPTPYKRIFVRHRHVVSWRKIVFCILAAIVILFILIVLVLALL